MRTALALCLLAAVPAADVHAQSLVISGGTLIDGTGRPPLENAQVLVRDGVIAEITTSPPVRPVFGDRPGGPWRRPSSHLPLVECE